MWEDPLKRLALFLDGTWADADTNTNVYALHQLVAAQDQHGVEQLANYDSGVGTTWGERLRGGMFGFGLMRNVIEAYTWLVANYKDGDQIFLFGYSRGAFTARSVAGVIARCGLAREPNPDTIARIVDRYRHRPTAEQLWRLERRTEQTLAERPEEDRWLVEHSRRVQVHFIGVWDTVGALGVPLAVLSWLPGIGRHAQRFHNTNPSRLYTNMFHALAIDENRGPFKATLWTDIDPDVDPEKPLVQDDQRIEQRWFVGAHGNVGGGGSGNALARIPASWMQERATECGLGFKSRVAAGARDHRAPVRDSYRSFLKGFYRLVRPRHWRTIDRDPRSVTLAGDYEAYSHTLGEIVDESALQRWDEDPDYRPRNLADWRSKGGASE